MNLEIRTLPLDEAIKYIYKITCLSGFSKDVGSSFEFKNPDNVVIVLAYDDCAVIGFSAIEFFEYRSEWSFSYVIDGYRNQGVLKAIDYVRIKLCEKLPINTVIRESRIKHYTNIGFKEEKRRGQWVTMVKNCDAD